MRLSIAALAVSVLAGCAEPSFDGLSIRPVRHAEVEVEDGALRMFHGQAVGVHVRPLAKPGASYRPYDIVELEPEDRDVLDVLPGEDLEHHVLVGVAPGRTRLIATLDGEEVAEIVATVREQESSEN